MKNEQENPSVGVILGSSKDKYVVEYSISKNMSQTIYKKLNNNNHKVIDKLYEII